MCWGRPGLDYAWVQGMRVCVTDPRVQLRQHCNSARLAGEVATSGFRSGVSRGCSAREQTSWPIRVHEMFAESVREGDCGHGPRKESLLAAGGCETVCPASRQGCSVPARNCDHANDVSTEILVDDGVGGESRN